MDIFSSPDRLRQADKDSNGASPIELPSPAGFSGTTPYAFIAISSRLAVLLDSEIEEGPSEVERLGELAPESEFLDGDLGRLREVLLPSMASESIRNAV